MFIRWKKISQDFYFETSHFVSQVSIHNLEYNVYRNFPLQQKYAYQYLDNNFEKVCELFRVTSELQKIPDSSVINPQKKY